MVGRSIFFCRKQPEPGKYASGGQRRKDDHIEVLLRHAGVLQRLLGGFFGEVGGVHALLNPAALFDARALGDPRIGGVVPFGQFVVFHNAGRHIHSGANHYGAGHKRYLMLSAR